MVCVYREKAVQKLYEVVKHKKKSKAIEDSIYNFAVHTGTKRSYEIDMENKLFRNCYKNKLMSLYVNFKKNSYVGNCSLLKRIKANEIDLTKIAFMKATELCPEKWEENKNRKIAMKELEESKVGGIITYDYKCSMCKHNVCRMNQIQTRSIDEAMTVKMKCLNCGHGWKFSM